MGFSKGGGGGGGGDDDDVRLYIELRMIHIGCGLLMREYKKGTNVPHYSSAIYFIYI